MAGSYQAERKEESASRAPSEKGEQPESARSTASNEGGTPLFLQRSPAEPEVHHSPPGTGPGSRSDPQVIGRRSLQAVSAMATDIYYRSPVNPTNPVLVWTNGSTLFFGPSQEQVTSGRMPATPEPSLVLPARYAAEELRWDRVEGLTTGGGPVIVIARKAGAPDLEITISDNLEQKSNVVPGITSGANLTVSREGAEFVRSDDSSVSLELAGLATRGPINNETFSNGFYRYRASGGDHDLYISQGVGPFAHLVERSTGRIVRTFAAGTIAAAVPRESGVVDLETAVTTRGTTSRSTLTIDLRNSPPTISTASGHASEEPSYPTVKARLQAFGITIEERGLRLRVIEMQTIEDALLAGASRGLTALTDLRRLIGGSTTDPILELSKSIGPESAYGLADTTGTPSLSIFEPFDETAVERAATVRHEMTHIIMGAIDAVTHSRLTAQQRADLEGAMRFEARRAAEKARSGLLRAGEYGAGDVVPPAGTRSTWRSLVGEDPEIANVWVELLRRYSFIADPEGTREFRGASLADESRYSGAAEQTGHPADSASEFVASYVTCATIYRTQFVADVLAAETAGNARGGGGGSYLRGLYRSAWRLIDSKYVPLGSNPF
ncbi:MAG TPA: hypothetical protein VFV34_08925 [Blastocatellia bacterium]|nr:hypothetical protein [Blastocatellia bacterium]